MSTATAERSLLLGSVEVRSATRRSSSFVRLELGGPLLAELGVPRPWFDQRIKLVIPGAPGVVPGFPRADEGWYAAWLDRPVEQRGHMRTYTVRDVVGTGDDTRLVIDVVVHEGATGPGNDWALAATPGDEVALVAPRRGHGYGGIEWDPPPGRRLLLVGDETAVPAICSILEQLPSTSRGAAFVEVPVADDAQQVDHPVGVEVVWLPRAGAAHGALLTAAVTGHLGHGRGRARLPVGEVDPELWETPTYSSSGELITTPREAAGPHADLYAWIAGESAVVTGLRRHLVRDLGLDRRQVAFMGYWRRGVAMRS